MLNESVINVLKNSMWDLATCEKGALVITPSKVIVTTPGAETLMISYKLKNKPFILAFCLISHYIFKENSYKTHWILSIYRFIFDYQYSYIPFLSYKSFKYATIDRYHDIIVS